MRPFEIILPFRIRHVTHLIVMDRFERRNIKFIIGGPMWTVDGRTYGQKSVHRDLSTRMVSVTSNDLQIWLSDCWILPQCFRIPLLDHCPLSPDSLPRRPVWNHGPFEIGKLGIRWNIECGNFATKIFSTEFWDAKSSKAIVWESHVSGAKPIHPLYLSDLEHVV